MDIADTDIAKFAGEWTERERTFFVAGATSVCEKLLASLSKPE